MDESTPREKIHLAWGSVFLAAFSGWAIMLILGTVTVDTDPILGALIIGAFLSVVTVPLLLSVPGNSPSLLAGGRILLWLQAGSVLTAGVLTMIALAD